MPKISDGFDYPVGKRDSYGRITATEVRGDSDGYNNAQDFGVPNPDRGGKLHLGEDWNDDGGGNSDLGDPVYAVSNGTVRFAGDAGNGWGNVIIIEHTLPSGEYGGIVTSAYEHLESIAASIAPGVDVDRGDVIGGIGKTGGQQYAHLHFEMRSDESLGAKVPGYAATTDGWIDPSDFIDAHRPPISERIFSETEPNNTLEQANHLGKLWSDQKIHISGHLNGNSDPYDYFDYTVTEPGSIAVTMYEGDQIIYNETFKAQQANEPFYYYGWAEGNADFSYDTYISLSPASHDALIA